MSADEITAAHTAAVADQVEAFYAAIEAGDLDAMTRLWLDSETCTCIHPGGVVVQGASAVRRSWAVVMAGTRFAQYVITDLAIHVRGGVAAVTCRENVISEAAGAVPGELAGGGNLTTQVWCRGPSGWGLWQHHAQPTTS